MKVKNRIKSDELDDIKEDVSFDNAIKSRCCFALIAVILFLAICGGGISVIGL